MGSCPVRDPDGIWLGVGPNDPSLTWLSRKKKGKGDVKADPFLPDYSIHSVTCSLNVKTHSFGDGFI